MRTRWPARFVIAASALLLLLGPAMAEDDEEFEDEVKALCKDFKANYKKMSDGEVTGGIDGLLAKFKDERADEKSKKLLVQTIGYALRLRSDDVVAHALKALGETDDNAVKYLDGMLTRAIKSKPPKTALYEACFQSLGKLADPRSVRTLTDYLDYKDYDVAAQAAGALQGFKEARGKIRKEIFEEILKVSEGMYSSAQSAPESEQARRWRVVGNSMMDSMNAVSGQEFSDPRAARAWYNENKKANWDRE